MFGRGEKYALFHQAGCVTDAGHVATASLDWKVIQIGTPKNNACIRRGRKQAKVAENPGVKTDPFG